MHPYLSLEANGIYSPMMAADRDFDLRVLFFHILQYLKCPISLVYERSLLMYQNLKFSPLYSFLPASFQPHDQCSRITVHQACWALLLREAFTKN